MALMSLLSISVMSAPSIKACRIGTSAAVFGCFTISVPKSQARQRVIDQRRIIRGLHGQRIARRVFEAGTGEVDFVMRSVLGRIRAGEIEHALHFRDAGVLDVVNGFSGFGCAHDSWLDEVRETRREPV
jgi:hypothetical protein